MTPDSSSNSYGPFGRNLACFLCNCITRYSMAAVAVYCCVLGLQTYTWFSWHVILCTIGLVALMAEALILFSTDELWSRQLSRTKKYGIHALLITFGTILLSFGCIETYLYLEAGYHLYTWHGITGLICMILCIMSVILGVFANYSQQLNRYARPIVIKLVHNIIGILGFAIGMISLCLSFYTRWFEYYTSLEVRALLLIATIFVTLWSLKSAVISLYNQIITVFS